MSADLFNKLKALGLSMEQVGGVLEIIDAREGAMKLAEEARKAAGRERVQRWREKNKPAVTLQKHIGNATVPLTSTDDAPDLENKQTNKPENKEERKQEPAARVGFSDFWALFPNKVGKRDAEREFNLALQRSSFDEIMAGLRRYVGKTDDRPWCNPSTFLHQDRWADQPVSVTRRQNGHSPPERSVSDVLGEMAAGTWTGPQDPQNEPFIETSFTRRN